MKMALRLRKDVQKASYYVWFLGAQEAKGLRGSKVLLPAIPKLLDRAQLQEPLKVTLQISHKGLKIIQVNVFIFVSLMLVNEVTYNYIHLKLVSKFT